MFEFLIGIVFAKTFLGGDSPKQSKNPDLGQSDRKEKVKTTPKRLTKVEREQQTQERRREFRRVGSSTLAIVPLIFVVSSGTGGFFVTSASCSYEQTCMSENLPANIESFGKQHVLAARQPIKTMQLIQPKYYIPYWLGLLFTYALLFIAAVYVLYFLFTGMSYLGGRMWRVFFVTNTNSPED